jgi:hypothetical protein
MKVLKRLIVPALLAVLVLVPFWDLLWLPADQSIAGNDLGFMFFEWWRFGAESLRQGTLPLWNPYIFAGIPFLANPQPAFFYPPVWLVLALPLARVATLLFLFHFWVAGVGMYAWLRAEGADRWGAFFGGIIFAFSGYFSVRVLGGHLGVVMTQAWLPAILWALARALRRQRISAAIVGGVLVGFSVLAGHTASFFYVGLALVAYALYRGWEAWTETASLRTSARPLAFAGIMGLVGAGVAAVQLLPAWELIQLSTRQAVDYAFATSHSWPAGYLITLLIPNFFGELSRIGYWGDGIYTELIFYTGVLPLLLVLALALRKTFRHRLVPFLLALGLAGILLGLGQFGILHRLAFNFVPLFQATRAPARAGFLFAFAIAGLAGIVLTRLRQNLQARLALADWTRGPFPWVIAVLTALVVLTGFVLFGLQRETNPEIGRFWHIANNSALFLLLFLFSVGWMHAWGTDRIGTGAASGLAIGLVLLDLWGFGRGLIQASPVEESAYWRIVSEITAGGEGRVLPWGLSIFEHNRGISRGVRSVFGYDPLELEQYAEFTTAVADPQARAYDLLQARYLVTTQEMDFSQETDGPRLLDQREGVWVYERPGALPWSWIVHEIEVAEGQALLSRLNDPAFNPARTVLLEQNAPCEPGQPSGPETVTPLRRGNNQLAVQVQARAEGILVLSEVFYPGWEARLDGEPVPLLRADSALRAVCVPAGEHQVTLSFVPGSLKVGAGISLLFVLLIGWAGWRERFWRGGSTPFGTG